MHTVNTLSVYFSKCETDLVQQCSLVSQSQSVQHGFSSLLHISDFILFVLVKRQKLPLKLKFMALSPGLYSRTLQSENFLLSLGAEMRGKGISSTSDFYLFFWWGGGGD